MRYGLLILAVALCGVTPALPTRAAAAAPGDPDRGAQAFRACAACHSLTPDKNMTGPSLAGLWGRKAGGLPSFDRYSPALKAADVVWDAQSLDPWIADPAQFIPGNTMPFAGLKDAQARADLIAFLKEATAPGKAPPSQSAQQGQMGGMMGGTGEAPNLKALQPGDRVTAISYCRDTYRVTTADGQTYAFWERNLRFKTDSSGDGPAKGAPAIVGAGMMGDRASIIFADPEEIGRFIKSGC